MATTANNIYFPPEVWTGMGYVGDQKVNCIDTAYRVQSLTKAFGVVVRNGYQITEKDCRDLIALCRKFNLPIPVDYSDFMRDHQLAY